MENSGSAERADGRGAAARALGWALPALALAVLVVLLLNGNGGNGGPDGDRRERIPPPASLSIPPVNYAEIDTILAGGVAAFNRHDYEEAARLLSRARFFIKAGVSEGAFSGIPENLDLAIGLSELYRGRDERAVESLEKAVSDYPLDETAAWYLALVCIETGDRERAKSALEKVAAMGGVYSVSAKERLRGL